MDTSAKPNVTPARDPTDAEIEAALLALVQRRGPQSSACPSEVARALSADAWRMLMPRVRDVASGLAQAGLLDISQRGQSVPPKGPWTGPIRVRLPLDLSDSEKLKKQ